MIVRLPLVVSLALVLSTVSLSADTGTGGESGDAIAFGTSRTLHSKILGEDKLIFVHLPAGYEESEARYPVVFQLYAHFRYAYYLPAIRSTTMAAANGKLPEMIVVGITNAEFRYRDLLPEDHFGATSQIENYQRYFQSELIPFIDKEYRTKDYRILAGPQAGAAFGIYTLLQHPDMFDGYILSNPFWISSSRQTLLELVSPAVAGKLDYSNESLTVTHTDDESGDAIDALNGFVDSIERLGARAPQIQLNQQAADFDLSVTVDIRTGLRTLFDGYEFPAAEQAQDLATIQQHYQDLSKKIGLTLATPEMVVVLEGDKYVRLEDYAKALELFEYQYEIFPGSLMALDRMGRTHIKLGNPELAIEYLEEFLEQQPGNPRITGILNTLQGQ